MTATLAELDLARAIIALRGPKADTDAALAALGRTPTVLPPRPPPADIDEPEPSTTTETSQHITEADVEPAITDAPPATAIAYSFTAGYTTATVLDLDVQGLSSPAKSAIASTRSRRSGSTSGSAGSPPTT